MTRSCHLKKTSAKTRGNFKIQYLSFALSKGEKKTTIKLSTILSILPSEAKRKGKWELKYQCHGRSLQQLGDCSLFFLSHVTTW